ncbi:hypothetical protein ACFSKM_21520 [Ancylobacter dichloromethanicus]
MHNANLIHAERAVPRYTSYPTAPHFTGAVGPQVHAGWLGALPREASVSLYLHVPFCPALCFYCGCTTKATQRAEPVAAYAGRLEREIGLVAAGVGGRAVTHIAWGGGTPSLLGPATLKRLGEKLAESFDLDRLAEHAFELDPRETDADLADALAAMGGSTGSASGCRISVPMCSAPSAASSPSPRWSGRCVGCARPASPRSIST